MVKLQHFLYVIAVSRRYAYIVAHIDIQVNTKTHKILTCYKHFQTIPYFVFICSICCYNRARGMYLWENSES